MKKNNSGFTLVEVMIALSIAAVGALGLMKMFENSTKAQKTIEIKDDISQIHREITSLLSIEKNCRASLEGKNNNSTVSILSVANNATLQPKFFLNQQMGSSQVSIKSMTINNVDLNGSDGSNSKAIFSVTYEKHSKLALGSKIITKQIKLNANLCQVSLMIKPALSTLQTMCSGSGKKIIGGLKPWGSNFWIICQDCSQVNQNTSTITSCQAESTSGVDVNDVARLNCINLGGMFDETTANCKFDNMSLTNLIDSKINTEIANLKNDLPQCVFRQEACGGFHPIQPASHDFVTQMNFNSTSPYIVLRKCCR